MNTKSFKKDLFNAKLNKEDLNACYLFISSIAKMTHPRLCEYEALGFDSKQDLQAFKSNPIKYVSNLKNSCMFININSTAQLLANNAVLSEVSYLEEEGKTITEEFIQQLNVRFLDYYLEMLLKIKQDQK